MPCGAAYSPIPRGGDSEDFGGGAAPATDGNMGYRIHAVEDDTNAPTASLHCPHR